MRSGQSSSLLVITGATIAISCFGLDKEAEAATCGVEQAAQAALERRLAVIDAAKVNPSDFFTGVNSCISPDLLKSFDLSTMIPDLAGFLNSAASSAVQSALNAAKQQVCEVLNDQINGVIGKINGVTSEFSSGLTGELSNILGDSFSFGSPATNDFGAYSFSSLGSDFDFNGLSNAVSSVASSLPTTSSSSGVSSVITTLDGAPKASAPPPPTTSSGSGGASWLAE